MDRAQHQFRTEIGAQDSWTAAVARAPTAANSENQSCWQCYCVSVATTPDEHLDELLASSWDMRAAMEANARALTALQRCIDDYRRTADPHALDEILKHIATIDSNAGHVRDALVIAATLVDTIKATH